jgi:hypothetical protein
MRNDRPAEYTPRVIALAIAFFGGFALLGVADGVFARFDRGEIAALIIFAVGFAILTWRLDPGVKAFFDNLLARRTAPRKASRGRAAAA